MKTITFWAKAIALDLFIFTLFYIWIAHGIEAAGSVIVFWLWFLSIVRILVGFSADKSSFDRNPRPSGFGGYNLLTEVTTISALVWMGYMWLPAIYLLGVLLVEAARKHDPKTEGGTA